MDTSLNKKICGSTNEQRAESSGVRDPSPAPVDRAPSSDWSLASTVPRADTQGYKQKMGQFTPVPSPHHSPRKRNKNPAPKQKATRSLCLLGFLCADL